MVKSPIKAGISLKKIEIKRKLDVRSRKVLMCDKR